MPTSLASFRREFLDGVLGLLWRQWSSLGVTGPTRSANACPLDPEALIAITAAMGRWDGRLLDEAMAWMRDHEALLHAQRLKSLLAEEYFSGASSVAAMVASSCTRQASSVKWKKVLEAKGKASSPYFLQVDLSPLPHLGKPDPAFARYGWLRDPVQLRHQVQGFDPAEPACLLLKLRAVFGLSSRCEILAWLWTHEQGTPSEIARAVGYQQRTVHEALEGLRLSGTVRKSQRGNETPYSLHKEIWAPLMQAEAVSPDPWHHWPSIYSLIEQLHLTFNHQALWAAPESLLAAELHQLHLRLRPHLESSGLGIKMSSLLRSPSSKGFVEACFRDYAAMLERL